MYTSFSIFFQIRLLNIKLVSQQFNPLLLIVSFAVCGSKRPSRKFKAVKRQIAPQKRHLLDLDVNLKRHQKRACKNSSVSQSSPAVRSKKSTNEFQSNLIITPSPQLLCGSQSVGHVVSQKKKKKSAASRLGARRSSRLPPSWVLFRAPCRCGFLFYFFAESR